MLEIVPLWIFWICLGLIAFTYAGYTLVLAILSIFARNTRPPEFPGQWPMLSALVVAHNEEHQILDKIRNILAADYPADRLEIIVCSDGSTDKTNDLVQSFGDPRVSLVASAEKVGVNEAFALGAAKARGEIFLLTDANAKFEPPALKAAARHFADPRVGLVSGRMQNLDPLQSTVGGGYRAYWLVENLVRILESRLGISSVILGSFEMIRREAYLPIPSLYSNDMGAPLYVASKGMLCRYEPRAIQSTVQKKNTEQEFSRRLRIVVRAWPSIPYMMKLVPFWKNAGLWLALLSHKYLRWLTWLFMLGAFAANAFLLRERPYQVAFIVQAAVYGLALLGWPLAAMGKRLKVVSMPFYFCLLQASAMVGLFQALLGKRIKVWKPVE